jgi:hypothetical protein
MAEHIEINGIKLLPLKDVAEKFSYSRDHVARLAREQKIVASQIGRQWFVDPLSLKNFSEVSNIEAQVRKQQLSEERKREQSVKQELGEIRSHVKIKSKKIKNYSSAVAMAVLFFGLLAGTGFYSLLPNQIEKVSMARVIPNIEKNNGALKNHEDDLRVVNKETDLHQVAVVTKIEQVPVFTEEVDIKFLSNDPEQGILILPNTTDENKKTKVSELFSDYLIVNYVDENSGVVVYDKNGKTVEMPFVAVPVEEDSDKENGKEVNIENI